MAEGVRVVAALDDPVGEELDHRTLESGIDLRKIRVPLGVVGVIYEARPNVTIDCAALTIKSGNAIVLRGSSYAQRSNAALAAIVREALAEAGLPEDSVLLLDAGDRDGLAELATQEGVVDLLIPRGGEGLKEAIKAVATVPVMYAAAGNCHVYVHADADLEMARADRRQRQGAAPRRLQFGREAAPRRVDRRRASVPRSSPRWPPKGSSCSATSGPARSAGEVGDRRRHRGGLGHRVPGAEDGGRRRRLGRRRDRPHQRARHRPLGGDRHRESAEAADVFVAGVDAAAVYVNASTRFTDGFEYGMGAEIGNSTQKLHARGPIGMRELTTTKYVGRGNGQVRG